MDVSFGVKETVHMMRMTQPSLIFCDVDHYNKLRESLNELGQKADIFTIGGQRENSEPLEKLLIENGDEHSFVWVDAYTFGVD